MGTMARAKVCLLLCIVHAASYGQPAGRGVIAGRVVDAASGDPVRKATVTVTWQGTPRAWATTQTDGSGRFSVEGLPAGKYDLRANKQGLGSAIYGANSVRELGDLITLGDGENRSDLLLKFLRPASISGRVVEPDGDPVTGVMVTLMRSSHNLGERVLVNYQQTNTNDRGEYKFTPVDPGEYYLRCNPNIQRMMGIVPREMIVPQYFGGARESKDAMAVHIRGGDVLAGMDFHLTTEHPATISGRVTGVPQLDPPAETPVNSQGGVILGTGRRIMNRGIGVQVNLSPAGEASMFWSSGTQANGPDYRFEMPETVPGRYRLQATIRVKDKPYYASETFEAHEGNNEIVLAMLPAVTVKGHLTVEGPGRNAPESFTVALAPPGSGPRGQSYSSPVGKDGSFSIDQVAPGEYLLNINPSPGGIFEKSIMQGDRDVLYQRIEIPPGASAPLNIVLSSNAATLTGEVDAGKRAGILLEPVGKWHTMARFYYSALADDSGKFKLSGVAPGKYKIFALEKIATASFRTPESAELIDALGEEVDVAEGAKLDLHPKLIPEAKAKELLKP